MDWFNQTLLGELERHISLVAPAPAAAVVTPEARVRYREAIEAIGSRLMFFDRPSDVGAVAVVAAVAESIPEARRLYAELQPLKARGIPVVFCLPERRLATKPPGWEQSGLHHGGMYLLASAYVPTVGRGSYVEFGVFDGRSVVLAWHALKGVCDRFYAFDSFRGIGGTTSSETTHFKDGQYYANLETFHYNLRFAGVDASQVQAVPGFFSDTIVGKGPKDFGIKSATAVHIDTDVYEPALQALQFISPALPQGALLMFDDYDQLAASNDKGERRAVREWLQAHPEFELEPYRQYTAFSRSFIVHLR